MRRLGWRAKCLVPSNHRLPVEARRSVLDAGEGNPHDVLQRAGMTWESLAGWLQGPLDATWPF